MTIPKPLVIESSTSESTTVEVVLNDLRDNTLRIPDYQRDTDQWDETTKSLFIESIINNLTVPAFFFEPKQEESVEISEVVDGQQRLSTLSDFYSNKFRLVESDAVAYLSPNSVHYAKATFDELPKPYQQAFKKYRLTVIKLRDLGTMRLEVFRRINQGGTPLSGHDIRLAYYGEGSPSVMFIRLVGIYDEKRPAAVRFIKSAQEAHSISFPWNAKALVTWSDWWSEKEISRGQTASESFLLCIVSANYEALDNLLNDQSALSNLKLKFNGAMEEALDACTAQLQYQDKHGTFHPLLMSFSEMKDKLFPFYEKWIETLLAYKGPSLPITKHRMISGVIGAAYFQKVDADTLSSDAWTTLIEFVRRPLETAKNLSVEWPSSKGRWTGKKGYKSQFQAIHDVVRTICK